ncbi:MAG: MotA/TolQ/ExbB proton channel family protein [Sandaracinaceae bacterium]|nr:putative adventurous gliding motility protein R [uncultured bacterium]NLE48517.1 MotA/TolQ/ExbB proton channel family protein [Sandaracinaceae bacterium]
MYQIWHALLDGAPFSFINMAILAYALAITAERFYFLLTKYRGDSVKIIDQVKKHVQAGSVDRAIKMCDAPFPLLQVVKAGLTQVNKGEEAIIASMDEKMNEVVPELEKRTPSLWTLANLATLVGLLGTIKGLIAAFASVGQPGLDASQKSEMLSAGISEAMWNTFFGLLIAVICMFFHLILNGMTKKNKTALETAATRLENILTLKPRS